jgi:hypothetical protein
MIDNNPIKPSLLTKTELEWILGNKQISKSFEYKIKSTIKKKIDNFLSFELPLLIHSQILDNQLIQNILDNPNTMLPILGKEKVAGSNPAQGFHLSIKFNRIQNQDLI